MVKFGLARSEEEAGKSLNAIFIGMFVAFGGVLFGFVVSCVDDRHDELTSRFQI